MTSNVDVEIGDDIWITDHQHPYYGKAGKVITVGQSAIGVRLNGSTSPVGIHVKVGQFRKVTFHKDWHQKRADCQMQPIFEDAPRIRPEDEFTMTKPAVRGNPDYELPFSPPAHFTAVPFQLSDSAIEWADGQRAARIDNLKKTVAFLQQEIERLEKNSVTFKVEHNAPERTYNFAKDTVDKFSDTFEKARLIETDEAWRNADQAALSKAIWGWLKDKGMVGDSTREMSIKVGLPWEVLIKHYGGKKETVVFPLLEEREEVIDMIRGDSK